MLLSLVRNDKGAREYSDKIAEMMREQRPQKYAIISPLMFKEEVNGLKRFYWRILITSGLEIPAIPNGFNRLDGGCLSDRFYDAMQTREQMLVMSRFLMGYRIKSLVLLNECEDIFQVYSSESYENHLAYV